MAEGQSRYGIMEELSRKKIDAKKRLSEVERKLEQQRNEFSDQVGKINSDIDTENATYKGNHERLIAAKEQQKKELVRAHNLALERIDYEISVERDSFEFNHATRVDMLKRNEEIHKLNFGRFEKGMQLEIDAIKAEIVELEKGVNDLKEMSEKNTKA